MAETRSTTFYYGWVIVAVSYVSVFLALGTRFSFGVFYVAILNEYGWSRGETAGAFSLAMIFHAIFAPISGHLMDRFGPRVFFPCGAAFLSIGLLAASRTSSMLELYLYFGVLISIGVNTLAFPPHMALISKWFNRKRGLANGLVLAGIGTGMMGLAPFIQMIIDASGWRQAFVILAGIVAVVIIPSTILLQRRNPAEVGQQIDGLDEPPQASTPNRMGETRSWTLKEVLLNRNFRLLALVSFTNGLVMNTIVVHQAVYTVEIGISPVQAASLVGLVGLLGSIGGILGGSLSDRIGRSRSYGLSSLGVACGLIFLILAGSLETGWLLILFILCYGFGHGALPPNIAGKTGDLFGGRSVGMIMGLTAMGFGTGGALGAYGGGLLYDLTGSYVLPFLLLIAFQSVGVISIRKAG